MLLSLEAASRTIGERWVARPSPVRAAGPFADRSQRRPVRRRSPASGGVTGSTHLEG